VVPVTIGRQTPQRPWTLLRKTTSSNCRPDPDTDDPNTCTSPPTETATSTPSVTSDAAECKGDGDGVPAYKVSKAAALSLISST